MKRRFVKTVEKKLSALRKVCRAFVRRPDKELNQLCRIDLQKALTLNRFTTSELEAKLRWINNLLSTKIPAIVKIA